MAKNTLWIGDKWQIAVRYVNPDSTPFAFNSDRVPSGEMFLGPKANPPIALTLANGGLLLLDQAVNPGAVVFQVEPDEYTADLFKSTPQYNRLHCMLLDMAGVRTTQSVLELDIRSPQLGDLTGISTYVEIITVTGTLANGRSILRFPVTAVGSYSAPHQFDYQPAVWAVDQFGSPVEVDFTHGAHQVNFTFAQPFTGTLYLG